MKGLEDEMNRYVISAVVVVVFIIVCTLPVNALAARSEIKLVDSPWAQVNTDGFGSASNGQIPTLAVFNGFLYAGTQNYGPEPDHTEIWRTSNGTSWEKVDDRVASGGAALIEYDGYLYCGSWGDADGGNVWRSSNGEDWTEVVTNGFGDANNGIARFAVYDGMLYASTWNGTTGTEIWRTTNGTEWQQFGLDGIDGDACNGGAIASAEFNGDLYWGIDNWTTTGAEIWRTDGINWTQVIGDGFGDANNDALSALSVFNGFLYASLLNDTNVQIWRSSNGTEWTHIVDGTIGGLNLHGINGLEVYNDRLYLVMQNDTTGLEVWQTLNGTSWEQIGFAGFGDSNNHLSYWDNAQIVFNDKLYIATNNSATGGEVWSLSLPPLDKVYLPLISR